MFVCVGMLWLGSLSVGLEDSVLSLVVHARASQRGGIVVIMEVASHTPQDLFITLCNSTSLFPTSSATPIFHSLLTNFHHYFPLLLLLLYLYSNKYVYSEIFN